MRVWVCSTVANGLAVPAAAVATGSSAVSRTARSTGSGLGNRPSGFIFASPSLRTAAGPHGVNGSACPTSSRTSTCREGKPSGVGGSSAIRSARQDELLRTFLRQTVEAAATTAPAGLNLSPPVRTFLGRTQGGGGRRPLVPVGGAGGGG